ncbi:MAG: tellurite resistance/C4-dicarboxylate transporter family protein, partial [Planctomycetota bacterium]|nr:tellurite resistance/C4-dicarboxylate transporter family protein [Planctomycetota bacterium]
MFLTSWIFWAMGFILYLIVITLVTYRLLFRKMEPKDWTGPYWICMGAVAITTLAGSNLVMNISDYPIMAALSSTTLVITFLAWAIGLWWIPIQIFMDIWSLTKVNISGKAPSWIKIFPWLRLGFGSKNYHFYEPLAWGRVFPMGMYTACTIALYKASDFEFLFLIPKYWGWFALIVWTLTFIGTMRSVLKYHHKLEVNNA